MGWQEAGTSPGYQSRVTAYICTDITMSRVVGAELGTQGIHFLVLTAQ